jgi:tryptophan-rich sensory protein
MKRDALAAVMSQIRALSSLAGLAGWLTLSFAAAAVGSFFSPGDWYAGLTKPAWNPPNWVFAPVWSVLYATMGVAAWLVWKSDGVRQRSPALAFFLLQLGLNALWSPLFFGLQRPGLAFAEIILLWAAVGGTMVLFGRVRPLAGWMLMPYLIWITFAAALNFAIWRLNT